MQDSTSLNEGLLPETTAPAGRPPRHHNCFREGSSGTCRTVLEKEKLEPAEFGPETAHFPGPSLAHRRSVSADAQGTAAQMMSGLRNSQIGAFLQTTRTRMRPWVTDFGEAPRSCIVLCTSRIAMPSLVYHHARIAVVSETVSSSHPQELDSGPVRKGFLSGLSSGKPRA